MQDENILWRTKNAQNITLYYVQMNLLPRANGLVQDENLKTLTNFDTFYSFLIKRSHTFFLFFFFLKGILLSISSRLVSLKNLSNNVLQLKMGVKPYPVVKSAVN